MPKLFERDGYRFFFYSNEHRGPVHVHVRHGRPEAVFDIEHKVDLRESQGFKVSELTQAEQIASLNRNLIMQKWNECFK